jgi:putative intracellular protease/amidase/DNA-directed RNA polymerase subunit RPC12/RpoP
LWNLYHQKIYFMKLFLFITLFFMSTSKIMAQGTGAQGTGAGAPSADSMAYFCPPCSNDCDTIAYKQPGTCPYCGMALERRRIAARKKEMGDENMQKISVCFYLQDGVEVLDFAGPMEVFSAAGFRVFTVSKKKAPLKSQGILTVMPDYSIAEAPPADIIAFFGGNTGPSVADEELISWVRSRASSTRYFFSVCTGAFILGKAGILDGLTATTFHSAIDGLRAALPTTKVLSNVRFVDNGRVITTAGVSAGIDGALHVVAKLKGEDAATAATQYMEYDKWVPGQGLVVKN